MAKGKIKPIITPTSDIIITRNGVSLTLTPIEPPRGDGKFPGLKPNESTTLQALELWTASTEAIAKDEVMRPLSFINKVLDSFNGELKDLWRNVTDSIKTQAEITPAIIAEFQAEVNSWLAGEKKERERDASYYRRKAKEQAVKMGEIAKAIGLKGGKDKAPELVKDFLACRAEMDRLNKLADDKDAEEKAGVESLLAELEDIK